MRMLFDFLKNCGTFFVLTVNGEFPAGRPFGAFIEHNNDLYISTGDMKAVYKQLKNHPQMQIIALKSGTREWIRINGMAEECRDFDIKARMLEECPSLKKHFSTPQALHYVVFKIKILEWQRY